MKQYLLLGCVLLSGSAWASAEVSNNDSSWTSSKNIIGVNVGLGTQELKVGSLESEDGSDNYAFDVYYRHMLSHNWGVEVGYHGGTAGIGRVFSGIFTKIEDVSYKGFKLAGYGRFNLSDNNYLYGKLGANSHSMDYTIDNINYDNSGVSVFVAGGWEYTFKSGIGLNLEVQHLPMDDLEITSFNIGMSYHF